MYQKTAKDIAYDKEREKFRSKINALKHKIHGLEADLRAKDSIIEYSEECIRELEEEIADLKTRLNAMYGIRSFVFECDPKKNTKCDKASCYINGGPCHSTVDEEFKKEN